MTTPSTLHPVQFSRPPDADAHLVLQSEASFQLRGLLPCELLLQLWLAGRRLALLLLLRLAGRGWGQGAKLLLNEMRATAFWPPSLR